MTDPIFANPRLADIYDLLDGERTDLDVYLAMVEELDAKSVLDVGCGTGTFACLLADRGIEVHAVDPAAASVDTARRKPGADRVSWHLGTVALPLVSFRWTYSFERDGAVLTSDSTIRFRSETDLTESLRDAGLSVREVRDAPDRPGLENVFLAQRPPSLGAPAKPTTRVSAAGPTEDR